MESTSITKALALLEATAGHPHGRSLAALAGEMGLPKPTTHRILKTLTALGYLEHPAAGVYRQSPQAKRLVSDAATRRILEAAQRPLRALHAGTSETVNLGILRDDRVLYVEILESPLPLRRVADRTSDPFHTTALGRAIAAFLPADRRRRLLAKARLERRTPATIVSRDRLAAELVRVARLGHAIEADETDIGVTCIGAPVFAGAEVVGAVSVSVPTARAAASRHRQLVLEVGKAAAAITAALGRPAASAAGSRGPVKNIARNGSSRKKVSS
jgi:DNA-binding IclR family transcriptional regulator